MRLMSYFLGIEFNQTNKDIFVSQNKYAGDILKKFKMEACKSILTPIEEKLNLLKYGNGDLVDAINFTRFIWSLSYLIASRLDIIYGVGIVGRFMESPRLSHWQVVKKILKYIKGTRDNDIFYLTLNKMWLVAHTNSDRVGDIEEMKSIWGCMFNLGLSAFF